MKSELHIYDNEAHEGGLAGESVKSMVYSLKTALC